MLKFCSYGNERKNLNKEIRIFANIMRKLAYWPAIKNHFILIVILTVAAFIAGAVITVFTPRQYSSTVGLLVVQSQPLATDPFIADRSVERFSATLGQVIKTSAFFEDVMNAGFNIADNFPREEAKRRAVWKKKIETQIVPNSGILNITVYDADQNQAAEITRAIAAILSSEKGANYHGAGGTITIKTIDAPLISSTPAKPNIVLNLISSLVIGFFGALFLTIIADQYGMFERLKREPLETVASQTKILQQPLVQPMPVAETSTPIATQPTFAALRQKREEKKITTIFDHVANIQEANKQLVYGGQPLPDGVESLG